jgi:hypothetical protein
MSNDYLFLIVQPVGLNTVLYTKYYTVYSVYCADQNTGRRIFSTSEPQSAPSVGASTPYQFRHCRLLDTGISRMHLATIFTLAPGYARPVWHSAVRVGVPACGCESLRLAAEERARMTRVQLFEIHFNIILAKAGTGRALLVPSQNYCKYFLYSMHVSQANTRPFHHYRLGCDAV